MSIHDPTYQLLDAYPITSHLDLTPYRDVKYLQGLYSHIDLTHLLDALDPSSCR